MQKQNIYSNTIPQESEENSNTARGESEHTARTIPNFPSEEVPNDASYLRNVIDKTRQEKLLHIVYGREQSYSSYLQRLDQILQKEDEIKYISSDEEDPNDSKSHKRMSSKKGITYSSSSPKNFNSKHEQLCIDIQKQSSRKHLNSTDELERQKDPFVYKTLRPILKGSVFNNKLQKLFRLKQRKNPILDSYDDCYQSRMNYFKTCKKEKHIMATVKHGSGIMSNPKTFKKGAKALPD